LKLASLQHHDANLFSMGGAEMAGPVGPAGFQVRLRPLGEICDFNGVPLRLGLIKLTCLEAAFCPTHCPRGISWACDLLGLLLSLQDMCFWALLAWQGVLLLQCSTCGHCQLPAVLESQQHCKQTSKHNANVYQMQEMKVISVASGKRTGLKALQKRLFMPSCRAIRANQAPLACCLATMNFNCAVERGFAFQLCSS
jgi:hypothetical protein